MNRVETDIAVIGAGVVGLAIAAELSGRGRVVVLERHAKFGQETSSRNSEVIHAGIYYPPDSLKARLCIEGRERLYELCARAGIAHRRIGKLIVASSEDALPKLESIAANAAASGVHDLQFLDGPAVRALEPRVRAVAGLLSPSTGIIDAHALMRHFTTRLEIAYRTQVRRIEPLPQGARLIMEDELVLDARTVIVAAGLDGDRLLAGLVPPHVPVKGEYFALRRAPVSRLVYPVPPPHLDGLGIHVTLDLAGAARLGPNTVALSREDCDPPGALAVDPSHAPAFLAAAQSYLEGIEAEDLSPGYAGIRPKLSATEFADFSIRELSSAGLPGVIALAGIESPGLTAAPALARYVASLSVV